MNIKGLRALRNVLVAGLLFTLVGCASMATPTHLSAKPPTLDELLNGRALLGESAATLQLPDVDILAIDQAMLDYLDFVVPHGSSEDYKARVLANSMTDPGLLSLDYVDNGSYSARETFHKRRGNCVSFTNLYVSLARSAGLKAYFQQSYVAPTWASENGITILSRHVNAVVKTRRGASLTVDFDQTISGPMFDHRRISDDHATALFLSNIGVGYMLEGNTTEAFRYLAASVIADRSVGAAWVNLGGLYSRNGLPQLAEAAYLEAVRRDPNERLAYSNLARLYQKAGLPEPAQIFSGKASRLQETNPYYHYGLAQQAHRLGNYRESNEHLQQALKLKGDEPRFLQLLSENELILASGAGKQS